MLNSTFLKFVFFRRSGQEIFKNIRKCKKNWSLILDMMKLLSRTKIVQEFSRSEQNRIFGDLLNALTFFVPLSGCGECKCLHCIKPRGGHCSLTGYYHIPSASKSKSCKQWSFPPELCIMRLSCRPHHLQTFACLALGTPPFTNINVSNVKPWLRVEILRLGQYSTLEE